MHLPPEAALWRSAESPRQWGWREHFDASLLFALQVANWQRAGSKGRRPRLVEAPGSRKADQTTLGTPVPVEQMRAILDAWSGPADMQDPQPEDDTDPQPGVEADPLPGVEGDEKMTEEDVPRGD